MVSLSLEENTQTVNNSGVSYRLLEQLLIMESIFHLTYHPILYEPGLSTRHG